MITISSTVKDILEDKPFLKELLALDYINLSALARKIKPMIDEQLYKKIAVQSIVVALHRIASTLQTRQEITERPLELRNTTVRSGLIEYVFTNSVEILNLQQEILDVAGKDRDSFVNIVRGVEETAIIVSDELREKIEQKCKNLQVVDRIEKLASVTMRLSEDSVYQPGVYYPILRELAWSKINVIEIISEYKELTFIFAEKDIDRAFSVIKSL